METYSVVACAFGLGGFVGLTAGLSLPRAQAAPPTASVTAAPSAIPTQVQMTLLEKRVASLEQQEKYLRLEVDGEQITLSSLLQSRGAQSPRLFPTLPPARIWPATR